MAIKVLATHIFSFKHFMQQPEKEMKADNTQGSIRLSTANVKDIIIIINQQFTRNLPHKVVFKEVFSNC